MLLLAIKHAHLLIAKPLNALILLKTLLFVCFFIINRHFVLCFWIICPLFCVQIITPHLDCNFYVTQVQ